MIRKHEFFRYFCHAESISSEVNSYTLEISMLGYHDEEYDVDVAYTDDTYCRTGRNMARSMWDYYKILGTIPLSETQTDYYNAPNIAVRSFNLYRYRDDFDGNTYLFYWEIIMV